jgi:hypothetical protein
LKRLTRRLGSAAASAPVIFELKPISRPVDCLSDATMRSAAALARPSAALRLGFARAGAPARARAAPAPARAALQLIPCGTLSQKHLAAPLESLPGPLALDGKLLQVGREASELVVAVPTVSARHAVLRVFADAQRVEVVDLGSTNATFVNGRKLRADEAGELRLGDEVTFGDPALATFRLAEAAPEPAEAA